MTKREIHREFDALLLQTLTAKVHKRLRELNVELLETFMPHSDPVVQLRAIRTIANLERQIML